MSWKVYDSREGDIFPGESFECFAEAVNSILGTTFEVSIIDDMADWMDSISVPSMTIAESVLRDGGENIIVGYMAAVQQMMDSSEDGEWMTCDERLRFVEVDDGE